MNNYIKERKALIKELSESLLSEAGGGGPCSEGYCEQPPNPQYPCATNLDCMGFIAGPCGGHCYQGACVLYVPC